MLINMRNALMAGGGGLSAKSYVQDGLIAMWDGIENAVWGVHDASATVWKNLKNPGTYDFILRNGSNGWQDNALKTKIHTSSSASDLPAATFSGFPSNVKTVEMVFQVNNTQNANGEVFVLLLGGFKNISSVAGGTANNQLILSGGEGYRVKSPLDRGYAVVDTPVNLSVVFGSSSSSTSGWLCTKNGSTTIPLTSTSGTVNIPSTNLTCLFGRPFANYPNNATGFVYRVTLYSRALTAAEIAANYAVDKARFNLPDAT